MRTSHRTGPETGAGLRERRQNLGVSLEDLASNAGVSSRVLELFELGLQHPGHVWVDHVDRVLTTLEVRSIGRTGR